MPHGFGPPPRPTSEVASIALATIIEGSRKEQIITETIPSPSSYYLKAAKSLILDKFSDEKIRRVQIEKSFVRALGLSLEQKFLGRKYACDIAEELNAAIADKAQNLSDLSLAKAAIDILCWRTIQEAAEYRPSNVIRREILKRVATRASEMKTWSSTLSVPKKEQEFEARVASLLQPAHGSMNEYQDLPTQDSLKVELDKVKGHVALMVMKRQLMSSNLPWGLYRCGPHAILLFTGRDNAHGLVDLMRPLKERIDSAILYFADKGPFSDMNLIAELVGCVRTDGPVIIMNCRCNYGHEYGPEVVAKGTGRSDVRFWRRERHDMENVMLGQLVHFAIHGHLSLIEPIRRSDSVR